MTHTTNIQATAEILRGLGIDDDIATRAAGELADAGLVTPDLPEPDDPSGFMPAWNIGEMSVSATPDCAVMVTGDGRAALFADLDELDRYALALLAAGARSRARAKQIASNMSSEMSDVFGDIFRAAGGTALDEAERDELEGN